MNETVSITPPVGPISAPATARAISTLPVDHISSEYLGIVTLTVVTSLSPARPTLIITGGPSLVTGTVGTDCVPCVNATIKLGKVAEMVGDTDISPSDKIGITMTGNCRVMKPYLVLGAGLWEPAIIRSPVLSLDEMFEGKLTAEPGCELGAWTWSS